MWHTRMHHCEAFQRESCCRATTDLLTFLLVCLPQSLLIQLLIYWGSSSFKGLVNPHTRKRGTAEADAPINMYQSPQVRQSVWAEAQHQGLGTSHFRAFYHPPASPLLPIRILFSDRIDLTVLAPPGGVFDRPASITARPDRHARAHRLLAIVHSSSTLQYVLSNRNF